MHSIPRRVFLSTVPVIAHRVASAATGTEKVCSPYGAGLNCDARIPTSQFSMVRATQQTLVWCWAATLEMIFRWHRRPISQVNIVTQTFGAPLNVPANPIVLINSVNRSYVDDGGRPFRVRARVWGPDYGANQIDNSTIIGSLTDNRPLVVCNMSHMMVLIGFQYLQQGAFIQPVNAWVADPFLVGSLPPAPGQSPLPPGFRYLLTPEMVPVTMGGQLRFMADLDIS